MYTRIGFLLGSMFCLIAACNSGVTGGGNGDGNGGGDGAGTTLLDESVECGEFGLCQILATFTPATTNRDAVVTVTTDSGNYFYTVSDGAHSFVFEEEKSGDSTASFTPVAIVVHTFQLSGAGPASVHVRISQ